MKESEYTWQQIAEMLYDVCKGTYGKEFEEWIEAKQFQLKLEEEKKDLYK